MGGGFSARLHFVEVECFVETFLHILPLQTINLHSHLSDSVFALYDAFKGTQ